MISLLHPTPPSLAQLLLHILLHFLEKRLSTTPSLAPTPPALQLQPNLLSSALQEVTVVVGELADCHLAVGGARENAGGLEWRSVQAVSRRPLGTVPAGHVRLRQAVGQPRGVAVLFDPRSPRDLA